MVSGTVTIPKHAGPDGMGIGIEVIHELIELIKQGVFTETQIAQAINLCMESSTQDQWNNEYALVLMEKLKEDQDENI
jgi:hypothetical protein